MVSPALFSSVRDDWRTPRSLFERLHSEFNFTLDAAADCSNCLLPNYFTSDSDGLTSSWSGFTVFCNPPYSRNLGAWIRKAYDEVSCGHCPCAVLLVPARVDTLWFHNYVLPFAEVRFLCGRLCFDDSRKRAPFPSMVVIFRSSNFFSGP